MNKKVYGDILFNILIIVISLLLIMFSEKFINLITTILGISLLLYAVYKLSSEIKSGSKSIIKVATIVITFFIGILLLTHPSFINEIISIIIGLYIIIVNINNLMNKKSNKTNIKIVYILGVIIGVLCILGKFLVPSFILKLTGIVLLLYAIINVFDILFLSNNN